MKVNSVRRMRKQVQCLTVNGYKPQLEAGKLADKIDVLRGYKNLNSLNIFNCSDMYFDAYEHCFKNNRGIKSFTCDDLSFPMSLLLSLRNLESLMITYHSLYTSLDVLPLLPSLRRLTLICRYDNTDHINNILTEFGSCHLEELALVDVSINQRTFPIIKQIQNLKLLSISSLNYDPLPAPKHLPTKLKQLKLEGFYVDNGQIASLVERLTHLQHMFLKHCAVQHNETWVNNFDSMADLITEELSGSHSHRLLNICVKAKYNRSSKTILSVGRIRITNYEKNRSRFEISYPGMNGLVPAAIQN